MKKTLSILLVLALLVTALAGCKRGGDGEDSKLIGVCMQNMSSSISELEAAALKEMFEPMGYEVQVASADDSVSNQVQQIQNFILMDAEMLVVLPCEIETLEDVLLEAREAGIKVVISGGTGSISEDAYDAVSADDEYMIGMYVASVAKTWIEEHMDPNGDWDVAFLSSTISADAQLRCQGEAQIIEPWLKNSKGEYMNLMGEVVDEANRVENPVYCKMVADRVTNLAACTTEMDISGDNRSVVAGVLTDNNKVRVIIAYNSLVSTAGSQYIMDTYPESEQKEFAFFSGGVMGDEYEYLIGSVADGAGTESVFRGACQFGGGDAAATLANLANAVLTGKAGVDYGKSNANSIGLFFPIDAELNGGNAALVCFDTPSHIEYYTYADILAKSDLRVYWDSANGYSPEASAPSEGPAEEVKGGPIDGGTAYLATMPGIGGDETHEIDLMNDGTCKFFLPGSAMITDVYAGTYEIAADGVTVTITGLTNVDTSSAYAIPGLWSYIDGTTGNTTITIDPANYTYTADASGSGDLPSIGEGDLPPIGEGDVPPTPQGGEAAYTYEFDGMAGKETMQFVLKDDGTCELSLPGNPMLTDVYAGSWTRDGDTVTITGLTNVDASSSFKTPGLWNWIDSSTGDCAITVDEAAGTFTPAQ